GKHRPFDLHAVAHDAGVRHQPLDFLGRIARDLWRLETVEGAAEIFALAQDGDPGQPGLKTVEHELFVERAVVEFRHAPFLIVIGDVERILLRPGAAREVVGRCELHVHSAAFASPGNANRAQRGLTRSSLIPPALSATPPASASSTRSSRSAAKPRPLAAEPIMPTLRSPAITATPAAGAGPS